VLVAVCSRVQKQKVTSAVTSVVDTINKALLKSTHLNQENKIVTDSLTLSVRTLEPAVEKPTVVTQSQGRSDSVVHLSPEAFSFIKEGDKDFFQTQVEYKR